MKVELFARVRNDSFAKSSTLDAWMASAYAIERGIPSILGIGPYQISTTKIFAKIDND